MSGNSMSQKIQALHVALELSKLKDKGVVYDLVTDAKVIEEYLKENNDKVPF